MAYVKKADRKEESTIPNLTGIEGLDAVLTASEVIYCNSLTRIFLQLQTEPGARRTRVGNYQGLLELGLNSQNKITKVLVDIYQGEDETEATQAEKLLVAHGYNLAFGVH